MTKPRTWTEEDEEILRQLYTGGQDLERIAKRFDTTKEAIKQKAYRHGWKRPRSEEARRDDLASRLRVLLGEEVRRPSGRRLFSDEELLRFAGKGVDARTVEKDLRQRVEEHLITPLPPMESVEPMESSGGSSHSSSSNAWARLHGLDLFCREALQLELMDHQLAMAYCCLASRRALCLAGRQSGKDYTQAALSLWEAVVQPRASIVVVSAAQRQSDELATKLLGFVSRNEKLYDSVLRSSREVVEFTNGSVVHALPASGLIRGLTATRVLVNEARDILDEEATFSAVEPMLLTTDGPLSVFTTPLGRQGRIWEAFNAGHYLKTQVPSSTSIYASEEHLERQRLEMSAALYQCEYEAAFMDVADSYFSAESIQRCARDYDLTMQPEPGLTYSLGVDWARTRDTSVMVVVGKDEEDMLRVQYLKAFLGIPMPDQVAYVLHLHSVFHFRAIVSEYAGLGIGPTDQLKQDLDLTVEAFKPSVERKALGYDALKSRLERSTLTIPMHPKLLAELRTLQFRLTEAGHMTIHGPSDDFADALMLACWPFRRGRFEASPPSVLRIPSPSVDRPPGADARDPIARLQEIRRRRRQVRVCYRCGQPIEHDVGVGRDGHYHAQGCPEE